MRWWLLAVALLLLAEFGDAKIRGSQVKNKKKDVSGGADVEGSADREDDEDYLYDDGYDDDLGEGSGEYEYDDEEADLIPDEETSSTTEFPPFGSSEDELKQLENAIDDFHFEESGKNGGDDDGELYEYYNEEYEPDYDDDDYEEEDDDDDANKVLYRAESDIVVTAANEESGSGSLNLSYLYIMLASAFVSFALALATFFLCRSRSLAERERLRMKKQSSLGQPFTVIAPPTASQFRQSSIVKSYQRVPTSTREFLQAPPPAYSATTIDMAAHAQNQEPLLDEREQQ